MKNEIKCRFSQKHDIEANWIKAGQAENPFIPWEAELIIYDPDENYNYTRFKIGDGVTNVNDLPFSTKQADWNQNDENAADYVKNRTHYEYKHKEELVLEYPGFEATEYDDGYPLSPFECAIPEGEDYRKYIQDGATVVIWETRDGEERWEGTFSGDSAVLIPNFPTFYEDEFIFYFNEKENVLGIDYGPASGTNPYFFCKLIITNNEYTKLKQLDEKFIPDTIARVDQYDNYGKDSFSANDTAKAISAKSAAFGFNTQAGSLAYTVTALDPVAKTFTLDSVEGLEVDDIYTVDISFYKADGTATEELYANYGKITAISADNVVTVDTFPSDVARYRVPDEPYIDENGLDGEENVFRVIAKPNVGNRAIGTKSFAIGNSSQALSKNSVAMGKACIAYGAHSAAIGYDNKTAYAATSFGRSNTASGVKSVAIGYNNTSSGEGSIAFGNSNTSSNKGSFASGTINKATGTNSFAAGHSNKVQGKYSIALGYNNTSSGEGSTAFGNSNTASNKGSFASGTGNKATGTNSFALGSTNRATGTSSFAHGYNNDATQTASAVFGTNSKSQGESSFAAGASVEASGHYSQAFGYKTKATGRASFAEGEGTIASSKNQHVEGRYNIEDAAIKYAHIIGNGKDDQNRKNIYTIDWNGNGWFAGEVTVGANKEKLATEAELIELEERLKEYIDNQILAAITSALNTEV